MMMKTRPVVPWIVVLLALSNNILRNCQAERTVIVSTRVGLSDENRTSCATADTLSAAETFDNFTWWNLQLQFPVNLVDGGGISSTKIGAATKENGLVQAVDYVDETELVVLNWTIADTPLSFVLQWVYNDGMVWDSREFCQGRQWANQRGGSGGGSTTDSCLDRFEGGWSFGTCYHERDGMTWGSPIRRAKFFVTVDCCPSASPSYKGESSSAAPLLTMVDRLLVGAVLLVGLCSVLLFKSRTWVNHSKEEEEDHDIDPNGNGGSDGWTSLIMGSSRNAIAAEADEQEAPSSSLNNIRTTQKGLTTVRAWN
jgi:hypothetical protein